MRSIKSQLLFVISVLILLLLSQAVIHQNGQKQLGAALDKAALSFSDLKQVKEIEYDLLNLQRNVLLYISTGSPSAVTRFSRLMDDINLNLSKFETTRYAGLSQTKDDEPLERMRSHLADYNANFQQVVSSRKRRNELLSSGTIKKLATLKTNLESIDIDPTILSPILLLTDEAELASIKYIAQPRSMHSSHFNESLNGIEDLINTTSIATKSSIQRQITEIRADFVELTQLIQGNLFLVNVVMAGAANEFLYLSTQLVNNVSEAVEQTRKASQIQVEQTQTKSYLFSSIAILLALGAAWFTVLRILTPIQSITRVFKILSTGQRVKTIPGLQRQDEVGALAAAANIFSERNKETENLLNESQNANARMEELNKELHDAKQKAEKATVSKSMFLANMSHEIRTPMNGVIGLIDLARATSGQPEVLSYLDKAAYSSQILMAVINDILDFSKIEAGKMEIEKIKFSLHSFIDNLASIIAIRTKEKNLFLQLEVDHTLPDNVIGDPLRLSQILMNLSNNAVKFTGKGGLTVKFLGELNEKGNQLNLIIEVIDTGIGMSQEQVNKIFKPFEQADGSTDRKYGGTGLGLAIVTQLLDLMEGHVKAESEAGKGSCFRVNLPLRAFKGQPGILDDLPILPPSAYYFTDKHFLDASYTNMVGISDRCIAKVRCEDIAAKHDVSHLLIDIETPQEFKQFLQKLPALTAKNTKVGIIIDSLIADILDSTDARFSTLNLPFTPKQFKQFIHEMLGLVKAASNADETKPNITLSGHILLVEDNDINQVVAGELLKKLGLSFDIAETGLIAVSKIDNSRNYDAVLMDVQMPEMDGYTATRIIRQNGHTEIPIIGLSANAMKDDSQAGKEAGMDDYLTKPIKEENLINALQKYL